MDDYLFIFYLSVSPSIGDERNEPPRRRRYGKCTNRASFDEEYIEHFNSIIRHNIPASKDSLRMRAFAVKLF